jgi:CubicO group peptidase (beta-lactamase class C family)
MIKKISVLLLLLALLSCKQETNNELLHINFDKGFDPAMEVVNAKLIGNSKNKACYFDGSGDYVKLNIPFLNNDNTFSVSLWVAPVSYGIAAAWLSKGNANNSKSQWRMGYGWPAEKSLGITFFCDTWEGNSIDYSLPLFTWTHLVYIVSPNSKITEFYINGIKKAQWEMNGYQPSNDPVYLGLQLDDYFYYNGFIDELRIFKGILSEKEIYNLNQDFIKAPKVKIDSSDYIKKLEEYNYRKPLTIDDGIETDSVSEPSANMERLSEAIQKILNHETENIKSLLIYKDDKLIIEEYFKGHEINDLNGVASVTKSFTSTLMGIAIDKGYVKGVDEKVVSFFPGINNTNSCINEFRISHLLDQISGLEIKNLDSGQYNPTNWPVSILNKQDTCRIGEFKYSEINPDLIQHIIYNSTQIDPFDFAQKYLFEPLKIKNYTWPNGRAGILTGGTGLAISSRDMLKLGIVYLNKGMFNGHRVLSEEWVNQTMGANKLGVFYKNLWWVGNTEINGKKTPFVGATGFGQQHIRIFPEIQIVVVVTTSPKGSGIKPLDLINNEIIPALVAGS